MKDSNTLPPAAGEAAHIYSIAEMRDGHTYVKRLNPSGTFTLIARVDGIPDGAQAKEWAFIVRACNNHAAIVTALQDLADNADKDLSGYWTESTSNFMQQARAALKAATE